MHKVCCAYVYMEIWFHDEMQRRSNVSAVKIGTSRQIVIPKKVYDQLHLTAGDYLEVELKGDKLILTPKELIEKRLAEGLEDINKGRVHGPYATAKEATQSLRGSRRTRRK